MKISGVGFVYMITCVITNKIYIGSTIDIEQRWSKYTLLGTKSQIKLFNSFKKYGINNHVFEIVWAGELQDMLKYETLIGWGFNVLERETGLNLKLPKLGDIYSVVSEESRLNMSKAQLGRKWSDEMINKFKEIKRNQSVETKLKISLAKTGKKMPIDSVKRSALAHSRKVLQYSLDGEFIKEWESIASAFKNLHISNIILCCKGIYKTAGGFKWKYKE